MPSEGNKNKISAIKFIIGLVFFAFVINPFFGIALIILGVIIIKKNPQILKQISTDIELSLAKSGQQIQSEALYDESSQEEFVSDTPSSASTAMPGISMPIKYFPVQKQLVKNKKYLQIALNSTLDDAIGIISQLPISDNILVEAGTPLIKMNGTNAVRTIRNITPNSYIVADIKTADLADREVASYADAGANAATCLGVAPVETIDLFIQTCEQYNIDSMIDMMNVPSAISILKKLKKLPKVVILHRGVDETEFSREKQIPYYQIKQIKGSYNIMVSVAGGDTAKEVQSAIFNSADIVVVWKNFMQSDSDVGQLAKSFLKEVR